MSNRPETCPTCNRYTESGKQQLAVEYRAKPLSGIDLSKPLSGLIESIRYDLAKSRSQLDDIGIGFTGWHDSLKNVQGLLTCGLVTLHSIMEEMRASERQSASEGAERLPKGNADV